MAEPTAAHARELGDYVALVRRRWAWIVCSMLVGVVLALSYLTVAETSYSSTAKVLVEATGPTATPTGARTTSDEINLDTEAQLVTSEPVAERAGELLSSDLSAVALADHVRVTVPPNTTVLAITYTAGDASDAQRGAQMFARAYLENRQETAQAKVDADIKRLEDQIDQTTVDIQDVDATLLRLTGPKERADRAYQLARRAALSNQLQSYNAELAPINGDKVDPGEVIVDAQLPKRPVDPNPWLIIPAGLMVGLVLGLAAAAWRERSDKRIHSAADVERVFDIAPLLTLRGTAGGPGGRAHHDLLALHHQLRAQAGDQHQVVMLVAPDAPEVAERLAYSLSVVASRSGCSTTYVSRSGARAITGRQRTPVENSGVLQIADYADLGVAVEDEFRAGRMREELGELTSDREVVLLGLPNGDPALDVPLLARYVDVAVVVVVLNGSRRASTSAVLGDLTKYGVPSVLTVAVRRDRRTAKRERRALEAAKKEARRREATVEQRPSTRPVPTEAAPPDTADDRVVAVPDGGAPAVSTKQQG